MDSQRAFINLPHTAADGTALPAYPHDGVIEEEVAQDLLSSGPETQQVDMWSGWTPSQTQYSTSPPSQPGQFDFGPFAGWEECPAADFMPAPMPLQADNDMNFTNVSFQALAYSSTGQMCPNALQASYNNASAHTQLNSDWNFPIAFVQPLNTSSWHDPCFDTEWQPMNFAATQDPASLLVPHVSSTYRATTLTGHPTAMDPASSEHLEVPQTSSITPPAPFDFTEIERQSLQSSDHQMRHLAPQTQVSSFYLPSLDAPPIPYLSEICARSLHDGLSGPPNQMVLPTRSRNSPLLAVPETSGMNLQLVPKPSIAQSTPSTSSQSQALVRATAVSRRSAAQPNSKLISKTIRKPRRPTKHLKRPKPGALESLPGYHQFSLESNTAVTKHNSRFGKKLDPVATMTREKGACVLCRHHNKKCDWSSSDNTSARCVKIIDSGGTTVIGTSITACLTTFKDAVKILQRSKDRQFSVEIARTTFWSLEHRLPSNREKAICKITRLLDAFSTPRLWRTSPPLAMMVAVCRLTWFTSHLAVLGKLEFSSFGQPLVELSFYNTASLCRFLSRDSRIELLRFFAQRQRNMFLALAKAMITEQSIKSENLQKLMVLWTEIEAIHMMVRLAKVMFDRNDAIHKEVVTMLSRFDLLMQVVAKIMPLKPRGS